MPHAQGMGIAEGGEGQLARRQAELERKHRMTKARITELQAEFDSETSELAMAEEHRRLVEEATEAERAEMERIRTKERGSPG